MAEIFDAVNEKVISKGADIGHEMLSTEISSARRNGHLGHLFNEEPKPSGYLYCANSASFKSINAKQET